MAKQLLMIGQTGLALGESLLFASLSQLNEAAEPTRVLLLAAPQSPEWERLRGFMSDLDALTDLMSLPQPLLFDFAPMPDGLPFAAAADEDAELSAFYGTASDYEADLRAAAWLAADGEGTRLLNAWLEPDMPVDLIADLRDPNAAALLPHLRLPNAAAWVYCPDTAECRALCSGLTENGMVGCCAFAVPSGFDEREAWPDWLRLTLISRLMASPRPKGLQTLALPAAPLDWSGMTDAETAKSWQGLLRFGSLWRSMVLPALQSVFRRGPSPLERFPRWLGIGKAWRGLPIGTRGMLLAQADQAEHLLTAAVRFLRRAAVLPVQLAAGGDYLRALSHASACKRALLDHFGGLALMEHEIEASGMEQNLPVNRHNTVSAIDEMLADRDAARAKLNELKQLADAALQPIGSWSALQLNRRMLLNIRRAMDAETARLDRLPKAEGYFRLATHIDRLRYEAAYLSEEQPVLRAVPARPAAFARKAENSLLFPAALLSDPPVHPEKGQADAAFAEAWGWDALLSDLQAAELPKPEQSVAMLLQTCWLHARRCSEPPKDETNGCAFGMMENEPETEPREAVDFIPLPQPGAIPPVFRAEMRAMAIAQSHPNSWRKHLVLGLLLPDAGFRLETDALRGGLADLLLETVPPQRAAFGLRACRVRVSDEKTLLGWLCPAALLLPVRAALPAAVVSRFPWVEAEDWMRAMPESERAAALVLLRALLPRDESWLRGMLSRLIKEMESVDQAEEQAVSDDPWGMEAACCAALGFERQGIVRRREDWLKPAAAHPLLDAFGFPQPARGATMSRRLYWRRQALAVEHRACLWFPIGSEALLTEAAEEAALMMQGDAAWRVRLRQALLAGLDRDGLWQVCRSSLSSLTEELQWPTDHIVLRYPRHTDAPAASLLLTRLLGAENAPLALQPFTPSVLLLPTDTVTSAEALPTFPAFLWKEDSWSLLHPFSAGFGQLLMRPDAPRVLRLSATAEDGEDCAKLRVSVDLANEHGAWTIERIYAENEITLPENSLPTLRVSPSAALPNWHSYTLRLDGDESFTFSAAGLSPSRSAVSSTMPTCVCLQKNGVDIGLLPNPCRTRETAAAASALIGLEMGHSAVSMAISIGGEAQIIPDAPMDRVLLSAQTTPSPRLSPIVSCALCGSALWSDAADVWNTDEEIAAYPFWSEDSVLRFAEAVLWRAAYACALLGASDADLRVALPNDLPEAALNRYRGAFAAAAETISRTANFPLRAPRFADPLQGLTAYVRSNDGLRLSGGLLLADLGSDCLQTRLLLGGFKPPVSDRIVPAGIHAMLLDTLLDQPDLLQRDFGPDADGRCRMQLQKLSDALRLAAASRSGLSHARLLLDAFLQEQLPWLGAQMRLSSAQGAITTVEALLLLGFATVAELTAASVAAARSDARLHDHVPSSLLLCPSGRGWRLMDALHPARAGALLRLLQSAGTGIEVLPSQLVKLEAAHGLLWLETDSADPPMLRAPSPFGQERLLRFVAAFCQIFPDAGEKLFPQFQDGWGQLTQSGYAAFRKVCAAHPLDDLNELPAALTDLRREIAQSVH